MPTYHTHKKINKKQLLALYVDANWKAYTNNPEQLYNAVQNSLYVITAWQGEQLIGLIRVVGDGYTILYIQDVLVHSRFRRQGIGSTLLKKILARFKIVRQKVLLTDISQEAIMFYESNGFVKTTQLNCMAFMISN